MKVNLEQIYWSLKKKYQIDLLAGKDNLQRELTWVYVTEDIHTVKYIHGGELIITTGMVTALNNEPLEEWLSDLISKLIRLNAVGLIINIGSYIQQIPESILAYCNTLSFPLFTIPWEVHFVDLLQDICNYLFENEQEERDLSSALSMAIFFPQNLSLFQETLMRHDLIENKQYTILCMDSSPFSSLPFSVTKLIHSSLFNCKDYYLIPEPNELLIISTDPQNVDVICNQIINRAMLQYPQKLISIGVGSTVKDIADLKKSYKQAHLCMEDAARNSCRVCRFQDLGIQKILFSVKDDSILRDYYKQTLQPLYNYDLEHGTDYMKILKMYLFGKSIQQIADGTFQHRNTINYKLKKIKSLLGTNFNTAFDKVQYIIAFYIQEQLYL